MKVIVEKRKLQVTKHKQRMQRQSYIEFLNRTKEKEKAQPSKG